MCVFYISVPPGPPEITTNPSPSVFVENSVISFTCSSRGGKPAPTIRWLRNGQPLNSAIVTPPTVDNNNTTSSLLTVTLHRSDHSANYSCVVFNAANQNSSLIASKLLNVQCKYTYLFWILCKCFNILFNKITFDQST